MDNLVHIQVTEKLNLVLSIALPQKLEIVASI